MHINPAPSLQKYLYEDYDGFNRYSICRTSDVSCDSQIHLDISHTDFADKKVKNKYKTFCVHDEPTF